MISIYLEAQLTSEQKTLLQNIITQTATAQDFLAVSDDYNVLRHFFDSENTHAILLSFGIFTFSTSGRISFDIPSETDYVYTIIFSPPGNPIKTIKHFDNYVLGGP